MTLVEFDLGGVCRAHTRQVGSFGLCCRDFYRAKLIRLSSLLLLLLLVVVVLVVVLVLVVVVVLLSSSSSSSLLLLCVRACMCGTISAFTTDTCTHTICRK